jgi:hypothetical protein
VFFAGWQNNKVHCSAAFIPLSNITVVSPLFLLFVVRWIDALFGVVAVASAPTVRR